MAFKKSHLLALSAVAMIAVGAFALAPAREASDVETDCGCSFSDEPLSVAELLALPPSHLTSPGSTLAVTMHVEGINLNWSYAGGAKKRPSALVRVLDELGLPVYGATVTGDWSGCFRLRGQSGVTGDWDINHDGVITADETGWAYVPSTKTASCPNSQCYFTFTVTGVSLSGSTYDPSQNIETTDFLKCNPFLP